MATKRKTRAKSAASAASATRLAREKRKAKSLEGWRLGGTQRAAAKACAAAEPTIRDWLREDPEYAAQVDKALDEHIAWSGQLVHSAIVQHVVDALERNEHLAQRVVKGTTETLIYRVVELNPALARLLLVRWDPRYLGQIKEAIDSGFEMLKKLLEQPDVIE